MSSIFSNAGNPLLQPMASSASLLDYKIQKLQQTSAAKQDKLKSSQQLDSEAQQETESLRRQQIREKYRGNGSTDGGYVQGLLDLSEGSLFRSRDNLTNFVTGKSDPNVAKNAEIESGINPEFAQQFKQDKSDIIGTIADGRIANKDGFTLKGLGKYASAFGQTLQIAPELVADSTNSLVEGAVGVGATALGGAGLGFLARRANKIFRSAESIQESVDAAVLARESGRTLSVYQKGLAATKKGVGATVKVASQTSLMSASILQQMKEDYILKNDGKTPDKVWWAVNTPIAIALNAVQLGIFKKFFTPSAAGLVKDTKAVKEYVKEMTSMFDNIPKSYSKQVASRILSQSKNVLAASGAEAAQEYLQTWQEILASKMDLDSIDSAVSSFRKEIGVGSNQDKAIFGAMAGAAAGGLTKAVVSTPGLVAGTTVDVVAGTVQKGAQYAKTQAIKSSFKLYSPEERADAAKTYAINKAEQQKFADLTNVQIANLESAKSFNEIENEETKNEILAFQQRFKLTDQDIQDPKQFKRVTDAVQSKYRGLITASKASVEGSNVARAVNTVSKNAFAKSTALVNQVLKSVNLDEAAAVVTELSKDLAEGTVDAVKNYNSSSVKGLILLGSDYTSQSSKIEVKKIKKLAENVSLKELKDVVKLMQEKHPLLTVVLNREVRRKEISKDTIGKNSVSVSKDTLPTPIKGVLAGQIINSNDSISVAKALRGARPNGETRLADVESVNAYQKVMNSYVKSEDFINQTEGSISENDVSIIKAELTSRKEYLTRPGRIVESIKSTATKVKDVAVNTFNKTATEENLDKVKAKFDEYYDDVVENLNSAGDKTSSFGSSVLDGFSNTVDKSSLKSLEKEYVALEDKSAENVVPLLQKVQEVLEDTESNSKTFTKRAIQKSLTARNKKYKDITPELEIELEADIRTVVEALMPTLTSFKPNSKGTLTDFIIQKAFKPEIALIKGENADVKKEVVEEVKKEASSQESKPETVDVKVESTVESEPVVEETVEKTVEEEVVEPVPAQETVTKEVKNPGTVTADLWDTLNDEQKNNLTQNYVNGNNKEATIDGLVSEEDAKAFTESFGDIKSICKT